MMKLLKIQPNILLKEFVDYFWVLKAGKQRATGPVERMIPTGRIALIIELGDPTLCGSLDNKWMTRPTSFLEGAFDSCFLVRPAGTVNIFGVCFRPGSAFHFIDQPLQAFRNNFISLDNAYGSQGRALEEEVLQAKSTKDRINIMERFLLARLQDHFMPDYIVRESIKRICAGNGKAKIRDIANQLGLGERHLRRKFISKVGLNPKSFSRIVRILGCLRIANGNNVKSLTTLAYEAGYCDQSHFIYDFRKITGLNPGAYFSKPCGDLSFLTE